MALLGSQVNDTVMAYLTPSVSFSTKCGFSFPDVKNDSRPIGNIQEMYTTEFKAFIKFL